jgi:hypothetical protein
MSRIVSLSLLLVLVVVMVKLATAPLYASYTANECHGAYDDARSLHDTLRIDLHPLQSEDRGVRHRCGEVRVRVGDSTLLPTH